MSYQMKINNTFLSHILGDFCYNVLGVLSCFVRVFPRFFNFFDFVFFTGEQRNGVPIHPPPRHNLSCHRRHRQTRGKCAAPTSLHTRQTIKD